MSLRLILPVKPFAEAKQRLSPAMPNAARAELARQMFEHVLATALGFADACNIIVVSRGREVLALAEATGAVGLMELANLGLNHALLQAADFARAGGASRLMVVASDLPLLDRSDLAALAAETCAIAPDRHGSGTNALMWPATPPPGFHFGPNSFARHTAAARAAGVEPRIVNRPGLAHDVDLPSDLDCGLVLPPK